MKRLVLDAIRCSGCRSCVLACSFAHGGVFDVSASRVRIHRNAERAECAPRVCIQCEEAPCIASCPVEALSRDDKTGAIRLDADTCTGCRRCVDACPHEGVGFDEKGNLPLICDLCGGEPVCVGFCRFTEAIRFDASVKESA